MSLESAEMIDDRPKTWSLITVQVAREAEEVASAIVFDLGTTGVVTIEEDEKTVKLGAYFDEGVEAREIARKIESEFARAGRGDMLIEISVSEIVDQDWMQKWKEGFEAVEIGRRLIIAPSWKLPAVADERVVIRIDPGMAFGTGAHETTRLCLEEVEKRWRGGALLDVGTGTGILAIAAAKLAPQSKITAIDIDPIAVSVARENAAINEASNLDIFAGQPKDCRDQKFDVVVANLTAEVIIDLVDDLVALMTDSGWMILSGILVSLAADVERRMIDAGLEIVGRREAGEWAALVARKSSM
ncbi:MAG: 50S ribosomal protein L11 methyltransferase [Acidobacteriota bacterium]